MDPSAIESVALTSLLRIERRLDAREQVDALVHRGCRLSRLEPWVTQQFLGRVRDALPVLCLQKC
jgi:hypothetical protein